MERVSLTLDISGFLTALEQAKTSIGQFKTQLKAKIKANVALDPEGFNQGKEKIIQGLNQIRTSAGTVKQGVGEVAGVVSKLGAATAVAVGAGVKGFADYQQQMQRSTTIMQATKKEAAEISRITREQAQNATFSGNAAQEIARGYEYMAMAGWNAKESMQAMPAIINGVTVAGEDFGTVADIVTDQLTAFRLGAQDTTHFMDVLTNASTKSNTSITDMGEALKYCGPIAGQLGFSIEDTSAALGLMANASIKGSTAGTSLRTTFTNLANPSKELAGTLQSLGIKTQDSSGKMLPLKSILDQLRGAMGNMTEAQRAQLAETIAGKEGMTGLLAILGANTEEYNNLFNSMQNVDGLTEKMAKQMGDTLVGSLKLLTNNVREAGFSIGEALAPSIKKLAEDVAKLLQEFNKLDKGTKETVAKILASLAGVTAVAPVLNQVGILLGGTFKIITGSIGVLSGGFTALSGVLGILKTALLGVNPVFLAIGAVLAALLITNTDFRNSILELLKAFAGVATTVIETLMPALQPIGGAIMAIITALAPLIEILTGTLGGVLGMLAQLLANLIETALVPLLETILPPLTVLIGSIATVLTVVAQVAGGVFTFLKEGFLTIFAILKGDIDGAQEHSRLAGEAIKGIGKNVGETLKGFAVDTVNQFKEKEEEKKNKHKEVSDYIKLNDKDKTNNIINNSRKAAEESSRNWEVFKGVFKTKTEELKSFWNTMCIEFVRDWTNLKERLGQTADNIATRIKNAFGNFTQVGKQIVYDIWDGIASKAGWLWEKIHDWFSDVADTVSGWTDNIMSINMGLETDTVDGPTPYGFFSLQPVMKATTPQQVGNAVFVSNPVGELDKLISRAFPKQEKNIVEKKEDNRKININIEPIIENKKDEEELINKIREVIKEYVI